MAPTVSRRRMGTHTRRRKRNGSAVKDSTRRFQIRIAVPQHLGPGAEVE